ncbi:hypothetical protein [Plantactinospora veratri]
MGWRDRAGGRGTGGGGRPAGIGVAGGRADSGRRAADRYARRDPDGDSEPDPRASDAPASPPTTPSRPPLHGAGAAVPTPPATTAPPSSPAAPPPPPPPAQPVLLGPDDRDGLARMMDRYCDEHVGGASWADTRGDGGWECERLLLSSRTIDIDRACRDTYGDGAFAENREGRDPFGWRCFRR